MLAMAGESMYFFKLDSDQKRFQVHSNGDYGLMSVDPIIFNLWANYRYRGRPSTADPKLWIGILSVAYECLDITGRLFVDKPEPDENKLLWFEFK